MIFMKIGEERFREGKIKLLKHIFSLHSPPLTFSKNFLVRYDRSIQFYQRSSAVAWQAMQAHSELCKPGITRAPMSVCPSVCPSVHQNEERFVKICSSSDILVFGNIRINPKFERGHPEWGRLMRLRIADFGDFSTYKPPYLQNGAR